MTEAPLKAPFPWAGGKSRVADLVWERLGNVDNYVEPFAGSLAVLLRRPADHFAGGYRVETANDADHYICNFWRAVRADPEKVAEYADWPVHEADLHARHKWLVRSEHVEGWRTRMADDPEHYDAKIAGWWCWGLCCWIGSGWCTNKPAGDRRPLVNADGQGYGVIRGGSAEWKQPPDMDGARGVPARPAGGGRPQLTDAFDIGRGVNGGGSLGRKIPLLSGTGDGENAVSRPHQTEPAGQVRDLSGGFGGGKGIHSAKYIGTCDARRSWLVSWMQRLADRLRLVRTCYGHWSRICDSDSTITRLGTTGVFLDPPYPVKTGKGTRAKGLYSNDHQDLDGLRDEVLAWCRKWSGPEVRIAVCGYEGDGYEALVGEGWTEHLWEASGGYGNQSKGAGKAENAKRERIWFSPACLAEETNPSLF